jgi:hypothetical protein
MQHAGVLLDFDADDLCNDLRSAASRAEAIAVASAASSAPASTQ